MTDKDAELWRRAEKLANRSYTVYVSSTDQDQLCMAKNPELRGCVAQGADPNDAINNLYHARIDYIYAMLKSGGSVPPPYVLGENDD